MATVNLTPRAQVYRTRKAQRRPRMVQTQVPDGWHTTVVEWKPGSSTRPHIAVTPYPAPKEQP